MNALRFRHQAMVRAVVLAVLAALSSQVGAAAVGGKQWLNTELDEDWNTADNWAPSGKPTLIDDVLIDVNSGNNFVVNMYPTGYNNEQHANTLTLGANYFLNIGNGRDLFLHGNNLANDGTIKLLSSGGSTGIILMNDSTSFSGTGSTILSNSADNFITGRSLYQFPNNPSVLVNQVDHTIRGSGRLGSNEKVNAIGLDNRGSIIADNAATPLILDLHNDGIRINTGTLRAMNGATLSFYISTLNNAAVIEALDGSTVLLDGSTIDGGTLRTLGTGRIDLRNITVRNARLKDLTVDGQARVVNGNAANLVGEITNLGEIKLDSSGGNTWLWVEGDVTLLGSGTLTMSDNSLNLISGDATTDVLTNTDNHTIQGSGVLGANAKRFVLHNKGTVVANNAANALTMVLSSPSFNTGTLEADNGAELIIQGTELVNTLGTVRARDASTVTLINSTIDDGTLNTEGSGAVNMRNNSRLRNVTINSQVVMLSGYTSFLEGSINNNGEIRLDSADMKIDGNVTLAGNGTVTTTNDSGNRIYGVNSSDVLTNGPGHSIRGSGALGNNLMGLVNQGLVDANQTVKLSIDPSLAGGTVVNTGTLRGSGGGGLELKGGNFDNQGTVEALDGSNITYTTTATTANNIGGTLTGGTWKAVSLGTGATVTLRGNAIDTNKASVYLKGADSVIQVGTTLLDDSLHTNDGDLYLSEGRIFHATANGGNFANSGLVHLTGQGVLKAATIDNTGGIFTGNDGIVSGNVFGAGFIKPGSSAGHLNIDGNLQLEAHSVLEIELESLSSFDLLTVTGDVTLGGELGIWYLGYTPVKGDSFIIMTFANRLGDSEFDSITWHGFGAGVVLDVAYNDNNVTLEVAAVPEPETWAMLLAGLWLVGLAARRKQDI